jgi:glycosyltransferase involved in cell wall biosynthesis
MKILVIQDRLRSGGTERQSLFLARAFAAAGHTAELLTFRPGGALAAGGGDLAIRSLQSFDTGLDWFAPGLVRASARFAPDVALCMGRMANCYGGRLQRSLPGSAVVCTMRTGKKLPRLFRGSLRRSRWVIANSREARDGLVAREGIPAEKISVIYNPLVFGAAEALAKAGASREKLRRSFGAGPGTLVLLCVAMFRPEKNQRELVEIAAGLPAGLDWQLWLAGEGETRAACERRARELGAGARIKFAGFQADPSGLYAAADAAVHASESESLSNFLIEAQAAGLPAVAQQAQGVAECFRPGRTGWVIPRGDRAAFRDAIVKLGQESPESRRARADEARAYARATFDPAQQVAAHLELFERLAKGSRR